MKKFNPNPIFRGKIKNFQIKTTAPKSTAPVTFNQQPEPEPKQDRTTNMFKIGDKVTISITKQHIDNLATDYLMDLQEKDINGKTFDELNDVLKRIEAGEKIVFKICEASDRGFALKLDDLSLRYLFEESQLKPHEQ